MSAYFDDDSRIGANTYFKMKSFRKEVDFQDLKKTMLDFKEATRIALGGKIFGSEIFLFESCIYARVNFELLKRGFLVWQVYDGFYARKSGVSQKEFTNLCNELVENAFYEFLEHFSSRFRLERLYI